MKQGRWMIAAMVLCWSAFYAISKVTVDATGSPFAAGCLLRASALVFLSEKAVAEEVPSACIRCGRCADRCPLGLLPLYLADAAAAEDQARFRAVYGMECMNCGVCSYVCPAHRPLAENNSAARRFIRSWENARKEGGK